MTIQTQKTLKTKRKTKAMLTSISTNQYVPEIGREFRHDPLIHRF